MMEAKDTVMNDKEIWAVDRLIPDCTAEEKEDIWWCERHYLKAQAEISFKAGKESGDKEYEQALNDLAILAQQRYKAGQESERKRIMKIFASFGKIQLSKPLSGKEFEALFD